MNPSSDDAGRVISFVTDTRDFQKKDDTHDHFMVYISSQVISDFLWR